MTAEVQQKKPQAPWLQMLLIGLRLLIVCAAVAGVVSFVRVLTKDQAQENLKKTKAAAISEIFGLENPDVVEVEKYGISIVRDNTKKEGMTAVGFCVESKVAGFGGDMTVMVGYGLDQSIIGVRVVSHSETPGVGAKVKDDPAFLAQYEGKAGELILNKDGGTDIDAISGATISSRAVNEAVNRATGTLRDALAQLLTGGDMSVLSSYLNPGEGGGAQ